MPRIARWCNWFVEFFDHSMRLRVGELGKRGAFWVRAAMVSYLMRLTPETLRELDLDALKERIGFRSPIIGVHVRHGDACETTERVGRCKGFADYVPAIRTLTEQYNTTRVYLATDSDTIITQSKSYAHEFEFVSNNFSRSALNPPKTACTLCKLIERRKDLWDPKSDTAHHLLISALIDLLLLSLQKVGSLVSSLPGCLDGGLDGTRGYSMSLKCAGGNTPSASSSNPDV
ncbi:hypothetical protein CYMTET_28390 [Cymbomonas tetramitiformis]|uniref:Alpha-(1,6)-fucosyltransferase N- and catalytic domain-containing protein n=1 Tax=Cymbomonas tetramitiformis TaxID=36881 RepID=A0AAE0FNK9_9CHLO|nr:hypothetical protein CYMTET_28390 [Cymbomonas tetramitiformis]